MMMGNVGKFLDDLKFYDKKNIHPDIIKALMPYLEVMFPDEKIDYKIQFISVYLETRFQSRHYSGEIRSCCWTLRMGY